MINKKLCLVIITILIISGIILILNIFNNSSKKYVFEENGLIFIEYEYNKKIQSNDKKLEQITKLIKRDFDKNFNINNYEIVDYNINSSSNIGILFSIHNVHTSFGYYITIENNYIKKIASNNQNFDIYSLDENEFNIFDNDYSYLLTNINENKFNDENIIIKEQKLIKKYDIFTNKKEIVILTKYEKNGELYTDSYVKSLN